MVFYCNSIIHYNILYTTVRITPLYIWRHTYTRFIPFTSRTNQRISPEKPTAFPPTAFHRSPPLLCLLYLPRRLGCVWRLVCFVDCRGSLKHMPTQQSDKNKQTEWDIRCCSTLQMFFHLCELWCFTWESKKLECQESTSEEQNSRLETANFEICLFICLQGTDRP